MVGEIKTLDERKKRLIALGKKQGFVTYEQLADELKGLEVDSDSLDEFINNDPTRETGAAASNTTSGIICYAISRGWLNKMD